MSWYSTGAEAADEVAASVVNKKRRNFFTDQKKGEKATVRFLTGATESFNYKRAFVNRAKGEKMLTSPGTIPDPFIEVGLTLQAAFAWPIIDRRIIEFKDQQTGEEKKVGPRVLYFADGRRTQKQLVAFERDQLEMLNEERAEENLEPLTLEQYNLTSYDVLVSKSKGAPWNFTAKKARGLSTEDKKLIEDQPIDLEEELKPLPTAELKAVLSGQAAAAATEDNEEPTTYAYDTSDEEDETIKFESAAA